VGPSTASSWVSVGRTLGLTLSYTLIGRLSDIFGRRWFFIGGGVIALIGNIICATSYSMTQLIVGATVYGIGEATQLCFAIAIGELIKNKHRPIVVSLMFGTTAPISTFGPLIGKINPSQPILYLILTCTLARKFVQHPNLGWRWCFYLAIICNGLSVILFYVFYHPPSFQMLHLEGKTVKQQIKLLDFWGIGFLCSGATLLLLGISWGGSSYPWMSAGSIAPIVIGGTLLVVFVIYGKEIIRIGLNYASVLTERQKLWLRNLTQLSHSIYSATGAIFRCLFVPRLPACFTILLFSCGRNRSVLCIRKI
jgi:MFS family permease